MNEFWRIFFRKKKEEFGEVYNRMNPIKFITWIVACFFVAWILNFIFDEKYFITVILSLFALLFGSIGYFIYLNIQATKEELLTTKRTKKTKK